MACEAYLALKDRFAQLQKVTEALTEDARRLKKPGLEAELTDLNYRLLQGPIRVMVIGTTSAGKSTLMNAVVGKLVAPEGATTTSPVPVWILPGDGSGCWDFDSLEREPRKTSIIIPNTYLSNYCYAPSNCTDHDRQEKYKNIEAVRVVADTDFFTGKNFTLIDTPGINAAGGTIDKHSCDTERTLQAIARGAEMMVFVCRDPNIQTHDSSFVQSLLFGEKPALPLSVEESVFVVYNPQDVLGGEGSLDGFKKSAQNLFGMPKRVYMLNLRNARLRTAGVYPYADVAPSITVEERDHNKERTQDEKKYRQAMLEMFPDDDEDIQQLEKLVKAINRRAAELCETPEAILGPIYRRLRNCWEELMELDEAQAASGEIPLPEELSQKYSLIRQQIANDLPLRERVDLRFRDFEKQVENQREQTQNAMLQTLLKFNEAPERLNIFKEHLDPENAVKESSTYFVAQLRQSGWKDVLIYPTLKRFQDYIKAAQNALEQQAQIKNVQCYNLTEDLRTDLAGMLREQGLTFSTVKAPAPYDPTRNFYAPLSEDKLKAIRKELLNKLTSIQNGLVSGKSALSDFSFLRYAYPIDMALLSKPLTDYLESRRKILMSNWTMVHAMRAGLEAMSFTSTCYKKVFSDFFFRELNQQIDAYTKSQNLYRDYLRQGNYMYHHASTALKDHRSALDKALQDTEEDIRLYKMTEDARRKLDVKKKYKKYNDILQNICKEVSYHV